MPVVDFEPDADESNVLGVIMCKQFLQSGVRSNEFGKVDRKLLKIMVGAGLKCVFLLSVILIPMNVADGRCHDGRTNQ